MSDDTDWDPNWWKKERDASLVRRRELAAAASEINIGDSFLIVTEGMVTEPVYFELFLNDIELTRVKVSVIPGDASDPRQVIRTGQRLAESHAKLAARNQLSLDEPQGYDHIWAVVDTDVAVRRSFWNEVCDLAAASNVKLAQSTPCFEFWLLLHLLEHPTTRADLIDGDAAKSAVKKELGIDYSTNETTARAAIASFIHEWPKAVQHAEYVRRHHETAATLRPGNPSTDIDELIRAMNDSLRPEMRKL